MISESLAGKVAIVTGGSNGIGAATVRTLAAEGARIVVGYHSGEERARALAAELPGTGHTVACVSLDDVATHHALAQQVRTQFGRADVLVNSAGYTQRIAHTDIETLDDKLFNKILLANAGGPFSITRALLPLMIETGDAVVVNISSVAAFRGSGSNVAYCAAKAALDSTTHSLARAFGPKVRFISVSPAAVDTGFVVGRTSAEVQKKAEQSPLGRMVTPDDVAQAVLASVTHLRTATGVRIVIDGGASL